MATIKDLIARVEDQSLRADLEVVATDLLKKRALDSFSKTIFLNLSLYGMYQ